MALLMCVLVVTDLLAISSAGKLNTNTSTRNTIASSCWSTNRTLRPLALCRASFRMVMFTCTPLTEVIDAPT